MFSIITAVSKNGVIGNDNCLLWHVPEDLKRFKELTMGKTIVMGRKTFESLPFVLPGRNHIVLTKNKNFHFIHNNVKVLNNIEDIISTYKDSSDEVFIIGGGEIYNLFLIHCQKLYITEILHEFNGDTYFPKINYFNWNLTYESEIFISNNINYKFINYEKKSI